MYRYPTDRITYQRFCRVTSRYRSLKTSNDSRKQELRRDFLRYKFVDSMLDKYEGNTPLSILIELAEKKYP